MSKGGSSKARNVGAVDPGAASEAGTIAFRTERHRPVACGPATLLAAVVGRFTVLVTRAGAPFDRSGDSRPPWPSQSMPTRLRYAGLLAELFPEARFVQAVRDGRDVALACTGATKIEQVALSWKGGRVTRSVPREISNRGLRTSLMPQRRP